MPCIGQVSFLQGIEQAIQELKEKCQCPVSGKSHFYILHPDGSEDRYICVSMPCIGQVSFLPGASPRNRGGLGRCVNALYRASLISTGRSSNEESSNSRNGVNALYRASLISTSVEMTRLPFLSLCQCPVSGKSHFYGGKSWDF